MSERMWEELRETRAERDAAIAERDRLRFQVNELERVNRALSTDAIAERDRLRRELEALRDEVQAAHDDAHHHAHLHAIAGDHIYARAAGAAAVLSGALGKLDAILRGES